MRLKKNFALGNGHWGAWELGVRYSILNLNDGEIHGGEGRDLTGGLNWYLYPTLRVMLNYVYSIMKDRLNPSIDRGKLNIFQMRVQLAF